MNNFGERNLKAAGVSDEDGSEGSEGIMTRGMAASLRGKKQRDNGEISSDRSSSGGWRGVPL